MKTVDEIIDMVHDLYKHQEPITMLYPEYKKFYKELTEFLHKNNLYNTDKWYKIQNYLPTSSSYPMSKNDLDNILKNLEYIKFNSLNKDDDFWKYVHHEIKNVSYKNFQVGQYADAVENSFKLLEYKICTAYKAIKSEEKHGRSLMQSAFSEKNPCFIFENLNTESGRNVQVGYMAIFSGAMAAIRNPKAHEIINMSKEDAIDRIIFASMLLKKFLKATT